jgi:hypothetical protein
VPTDRIIIGGRRRHVSGHRYVSCARPYGYRIRHEDEKTASAIPMRIFANLQVEASSSATENETYSGV